MWMCYWVETEDELNQTLDTREEGGSQQPYSKNDAD